MNTKTFNPKGANPFPGDAFPTAVQEIINATNECLNFPKDFIGSALLLAASVAIGNSHIVQVKKTWFETALLWIAITAPAGTIKTHTLTFAFAKLERENDLAQKIYEEKKKEYDLATKKNKKEREDAQSEIFKPICKKYTVMDATQEALIQVHYENRRGIGVIYDELAGWFKNFNRYNNGSDEEFWLSSWSRKTIQKDRKSEEPIRLKHPFISVGGTLQKGLLKLTGSNNRNLNGFLDRVLFALPGNLKKSGWSEKDLSDEIVERWDNIIEALLQLPCSFDEIGNPSPTVLSFHPDAKALFIDWYNSNADLSNKSGNETLQGINSKLDTYIIRFALILELLYWACGEGQKGTVGLKAMEGAVKLAEYFRKTALKAHHIISDPLAQLPEDKKKLYEALPDTFTTAQGVKIAGNFIVPIPPDTCHKFFKNHIGSLFIKERRGKYEKLI